MRGGARAGAGRKTIAPEKKKVAVTFYAEPEVAEMVRILKNEQDMGKRLDQWVRGIWRKR